MRVVIFIGLLSMSTALAATQATGVRLPAETAGLDQVVRTLVAQFDHVGSRETAAVAVLKEHVLQKREKALVIYGAAHF